MSKKYKQKHEETEEKYDPFKVLPQEILDIIFGYLHVNDLKRASLVSSNWYNVIGRSDCIKRFKVVYKYGRKESNEIASLMKSNRQYQNIVVKHTYCAEIRSNLNREVSSILKKFSGSIKTFETPIDIPLFCDVPKLRKVVFSSLNWHLLGQIILKTYPTGLFSKIENYEELYLLHSQWNEFEKRVKKVLATMKNLKVLYINQDIFDGTEYNFSLRKFGSCGSLLPTEKYDAAIKFLKSQSATLEVLIVDFYSTDIFEIVFTMPNLNKLILCRRWTEGRLPINKTIKFLTFSYCYDSRYINYEILSYLGNLQVLRVYVLTAETLKAISTCPSLRKIEYSCVYLPENRDFSEKYPNIKFENIDIDYDPYSHYYD